MYVTLCSSNPDGNTPYKLWRDSKINIGYFHLFDCNYYILNTKDQIGKFDYDKRIFLGYSNI